MSYNIYDKANDKLKKVAGRVATTLLNTLAEVKASASSGVGAGSLAVKELAERGEVTTLYENSSGIASGSITLADSVNNYSMIEYEYGYYDNGNWRYNSIITKEAYTDYIGKSYVIGGYADRHLGITLTSDTVNTIVTGNYMQLYKINGIK